MMAAVAVLLPGEVAAHCRASGVRTLVGTVNGVPIRRRVRDIGDGQTGLAVGGAFLADAGAALGDLVEVELDYAADPDAVRIPPALAAGLDARPDAADAFDALTASKQRGLCMEVERGRSADVRARRAERLAAGLVR